MKRVNVLHIRMTSGRGGGPEKTLLKSGRLIDSRRFGYTVGYLRRHDGDISAVMDLGRGAGLDYREFPGRLFIDLGQLRAIRRCIRETGAHILHCHDPKTDVYGLVLKRLCPDLRLVGTMHGWMWRTSLRRVFSNRLDLWALSAFDVTIAVSDAVRRIAERHGLRNVRVIHNAIDTDEWDTESPGDRMADLRDPGTFLIGFVGRLSSEKCPLDFISVAEAVAARDKTCRFVVVGEGPDRSAAQELALSRGLGGTVRFTGLIEPSEMISLYRDLDLLLLTSRTEGLPNTVLEALAMQVPVVATDVGGVGEIVVHGSSGLLAAQGDIEALANHVMAVKDDPGLADRLKKGGRKVVEQRFSFRSRMRQIEETYHHLAQLPRGGDGITPARRAKPGRTRPQWMPWDRSR